MQFQSKKPQYEYLRKKFIARHAVIQNNFWEKHKDALKTFALSSLSGFLLLSPPAAHYQLPPPGPVISQDNALKDFDRNVLLAESLSKIIPAKVRPLEETAEKEITAVLSSYFGFKVTAQLDGIRLNRNYGLIGGEQHLYRFPGDNLYAHADNASDWAKYGDAGIAPGLGAWGYFVPSKSQFNEEDKMRERYYLAIQTFLAPGFAENFTKYRDFFKFRKMLVINPVSGQAVVAVIGDAGPAEFTGKHLGGSPEVIAALGLASGSRKGPVLYFFIADYSNQIPLGPVKVKDQI